MQDGQVGPLLGVFQHLVGSKANDAFGFELLEAMFEFLPLYVPSLLPPSVLTRYRRQVRITTVHVESDLRTPSHEIADE